MEGVYGNISTVQSRPSKVVESWKRLAGEFKMLAISKIILKKKLFWLWFTIDTSHPISFMPNMFYMILSAVSTTPWRWDTLVKCLLNQSLKSVSLSYNYMAVTSSCKTMTLCSFIISWNLLFKVREVSLACLKVHKPVGIPDWLGAVVYGMLKSSLGPKNEWYRIFSWIFLQSSVQVAQMHFKPS